MDWYIGQEWKCERKGLRKKVLDLAFQALDKAHPVSKVLIRVEQIENLNGRPSEHLSQELLGKQQEFEMGTALTPVDYNVEILVRQMLLGERALCHIKTKSDEEISFTVKLEKIIASKETHKLDVVEMYELAKRYKENGVKMFKDYPRFSHEYFCRAAKCLLSYKPFDNLSKAKDGVEGSDMANLLIQIQTNLAACLLTEKRYEDVIYQTEFVQGMAQPTEKSVYRRAMAFYHIKEYKRAKQIIEEKVPNYKEKKEFSSLLQRINESAKVSQEQYKNVVQKMFAS